MAAGAHTRLPPSFVYMNTISPLVSHNLAIAKVLAILLVATGHFFTGNLLWIPVTLGLFTFAWSSALFTTLKHGEHLNLATFWRNKLKGLGLRFLLIQLFLLVLVAIQHRSGIFTWQTLVHLSGQTGWLNWFGIPNASPLGGGLWFFTLLLLFYLAFPVLARWQRNARASAVITIAIVIVACWLSNAVNVGHALWITAAAFVVGIHCAILFPATQNSGWRWPSRLLWAWDCSMSPGASTARIPP
ncbi:hypothetical protein AGMMS50225_11300 [Betaproteobacteria bacterium]|nr:hypothetical protein AGMMS50225_11300 [Betaproteobacteria bacterium]